MPGTGDRVILDEDYANSFAIDLNVNGSAGSLLFEDGTSYSLNNGANTLSLASGDITTTGNAAHTIDCNVQLQAQGDWSIGASSPLTVSGNVSGGFALVKAGAGTVVFVQRTGNHLIVGHNNSSTAFARRIEIPYGATGDGADSIFDVDYADSFEAAPGDSFLILTAGELIGEFATTSFPDAQNWVLDYDYDADTVRLVVAKGATPR